MTRSWECGHRLIHTHSLLDPKPFTPLLPGHILRLRGCLETRRSGISPSGNQPKPNLRPKAPRLNPVFSPKRAVGRRSGRSWRSGRRDPVVPSPRRWVYLTQTSARLSLAALRRDSRCGVFVKPHSLILSFPSIQHPCTLLASGLCIFFLCYFFVLKDWRFFSSGGRGCPDGNTSASGKGPSTQ